jgi:hypothetical protein
MEAIDTSFGFPASQRGIWSGSEIRPPHGPKRRRRLLEGNSKVSCCSRWISFVALVTAFHCQLDCGEADVWHPSVGGAKVG